MVLAFTSYSKNSYYITEAEGRKGQCGKWGRMNSRKRDSRTDMKGESKK